MMLTIHYLFARRFRWTDRRLRKPDFTVVAGNPATGQVRVHELDGSRSWLPASVIFEALHAGIVEESETGPPFVLERVYARRPSAAR